MAKQQREPKAPGENKRVLKNALEALKHPRVDVKDPKAIQERITEYLEYCMENDIIPGVVARRRVRCECTRSRRNSC